eukprot:16221-Pleurochrysis_carterae.AAC.3
MLPPSVQSAVKAQHRPTFLSRPNVSTSKRRSRLRDQTLRSHSAQLLSCSCTIRSQVRPHALKRVAVCADRQRRREKQRRRGKESLNTINVAFKASTVQ